MIARDPATALVADFSARLGALSALTVRSIPWASITFIGARHVVSFTVPDGPAVAAFVATIAEADLPLRDGFVADVVVAGRTPVADGVRLTIEALTIDDA